MLGALATLAANWKWIGAGLLTVALFGAGVLVKSKFERAAQADALDRQLSHERAMHKESEAARVKLAGDLAKATGIVHTQIKEVIRRVPQLVRDDRACDLSGDLVGVLNGARGYDVPGAGRAAAPAAGSAATPP